jgi:hypothetical protein
VLQTIVHADPVGGASFEQCARGKQAKADSRLHVERAAARAAGPPSSRTGNARELPDSATPLSK